MPPAVLELPGGAGDALRVPPAAVAAVLQDTRWGARLRWGATSGPKAVPRGRASFFGGKGWRGATRSGEGSSEPGREQRTPEQPRWRHAGKPFAAQPGPAAVPREEESSGSDVLRQAPLAGETLGGTRAGSASPTAGAGPDPPAAPSCLCPPQRAARPGSAASPGATDQEEM